MAVKRTIRCGCVTIRLRCSILYLTHKLGASAVCRYKLSGVARVLAARCTSLPFQVLSLSIRKSVVDVHNVHVTTLNEPPAYMPAQRSAVQSFAVIMKIQALKVDEGDVSTTRAYRWPRGPFSRTGGNLFKHLCT